MPGDWRVVGTIRSVAPARRECRVRPAPGEARQFEGRAWLWAGQGDQALRCRIDGVRWHHDEAIVTLAAGVPRERMAPLRGWPVCIPEADAYPPEAGAWHEADWTGCAVEGPDGAPLGTLEMVMDTPAHPVLVIRETEGARLLVPAIPETVEDADPDARVVRLGDIGPYAVREEAGDAD